MKFPQQLREKYIKEGYLVLNLVKLSDAGYPDMLILKDGEATFIEIKEGRDTLKPLQKYRIDQLRKKGFKAFCVHKTCGIVY